MMALLLHRLQISINKSLILMFAFILLQNISLFMNQTV